MDRYLVVDEAGVLDLFQISKKGFKTSVSLRHRNTIFFEKLGFRTFPALETNWLLKEERDVAVVLAEIRRFLL
ncbi:hypothetical protein L596_008519 [Steinernema carpocapsae]|uniref:Uncharacterized protein n=1 Tax=Steinernema carpocapsae TaxID=34508 RepID=A0A4U5PD09_STECR|nr:hypothetical protein L596_008519 [Steinernema carpocapsae]